MIGEVSFVGIYVPWLLVLCLLSLIATKALSWLLARFGFYRLVWHPALFDAALLMIVLALASFLSSPDFY